ncbi:MAG: universal stress protein [Lacibacter sp.]
MKKFLAVFDGYRLTKSTAQYAVELAAAAGAHLVAVFPDDPVNRTYNIAQVYKKFERPEEELQRLDEKDRLRMERSIRQIKQMGKAADISFSVRRDKGFALPELKQESMFADLLIVFKGEAFSRYRQKPPTRFIRELLTDVQCPVLLVPESYKKIDTITLLYDGSPSAVYAVKMFSYLFGTMGNMPVEVFTVIDRHVSLRNVETELFREFIRQHFPDARFKVVKGEAEDRILRHLQEHEENELVVLGAYRRTELSRFFRASMADVLMRVVDTPLFVAHQ